MALSSLAMKLSLSQLSIKTKLLLLSLLMLLYPLLFIGGAGMWFFSKTLRENFLFYSDKEVSLLTSMIPDRLNDLREAMLNTLYGSEIYQFRRIDDPALRERQARTYIRGMVRNNPAIERVILVYLDGLDRDIYSTESNRIEENNFHPPQAYALETLVERIRYSLDDDNNLDYFYYLDSGRESRVYMGTKFYQLSDHYIPVGLLIFEINKDYLFEQFEALEGDPLEELLIFDPGGKLLWRRGGDQVPQDHSFHNPPWAYDYPGFPQGASYINGHYLIHRTMTEPQWTVLAQSSPGQLIEVMRDVSLRMLFFCLLSIPVFLFLMLLFHRSMVRPLQGLVEVMGKVEQGHWGEMMSHHRKDEIGQLIDSFNQMSMRISELVRSLYEEEIELQNAQIKALQTQMNPHFLFNTLEAINWRAIMEEQEEISQMIQALAAITSASIDRNNQRFVSLCQEKEYLESYLLLLDKRYGEKIDLSLVIPDALLEYRIPRLMLQPLVENAVVHGIEKRGNGSLGISIEREEQRLRITVEDDGPGMSPRRLEEMEAILKGKAVSRARKPVALQNVRRRLELIYKESFQIQLSSLEGKGTRISLTIPLEIHEEEPRCTEFY